jgi:hypothetical protein
VRRLVSKSRSRKRTERYARECGIEGTHERLFADVVALDPSSSGSFRAAAPP